ncbi:MAG TPA: hypothetical protein ENJ37_10060 [Deltaproteobacteria bacterium]|nr:hypothetical protein [Deltaproteobacteria bacterium]
MEEAAALREEKKPGLKDRIIDLIQEDVPDHLNGFVYCMGATPLVMFVVAAATGILMTFYYIPYPGRAYESVKLITEGVYLGWFVRGLHKVSINLMIFTLLLHMIRVFVTRAYSGGEAKWLAGAAVFFTTLAMGFTGYSLVYDQVSYWGMTVVLNMLAEIPLVGPPTAYLLRGGAEVSELTLLRLYDLHTKLLPLVLVLLVAGHILVVRYLGFARIEGEEEKVHPFYPDHLLKTGLVAVALLLFMVNIVMIYPPELGPPADPLEVANNVAPPWYFSALYRWISLAPRGPALFSILVFYTGLVVYPYIDGFLRNRGYNMYRVNAAVATAAILFFTALTLAQAFA